MTYVGWFNHRRLHGELTDDNSWSTTGTGTTTVGPRPSEVAFYAAHQTGPERVESQ